MLPLPLYTMTFSDNADRWVWTQLQVLYWRFDEWTGE